MPVHAAPEERRLYVVEAARRRVVASARDAGMARARAAALLGLQGEDRDQMTVREPEVEEADAYDAQARAFSEESGFRLSALPL